MFLALEDKNVHCVAIKGTFDDCQDIVKERFGPVLRALGHGTRRFKAVSVCREPLGRLSTPWTRRMSPHGHARPRSLRP